jgi:hypothetical protein
MMVLQEGISARDRRMMAFQGRSCARPVGSLARDLNALRHIDQARQDQPRLDGLSASPSISSISRHNVSQRYLLWHTKKGFTVKTVNP